MQRVFRNQHALILASQAIGCGMTYNGLARETAAARLDRYVHGLYRDPRQPRTHHQRVMAAVLVHRDEAFASSTTAAWLYGVDGYRPGRVVLAVERGGHHYNPLAKVQQIAGLTARDRRRVAGIPCLSPELTLLTLAARPHCTYDSLETDFVDMACKGLVTTESTLICLDRFAARGRNGAALLRRVAGAWDGRRLPGSPKELELGRLLAAHGEEVVYQFPVEVSGGVTLHADLGVPARSVLVEYQSDEQHSTRKARRNDARRALLMRAAGFEVLPATQDDIDDDCSALLAAIRSVAPTRSG